MYDITKLGSVIKKSRTERKISQEKLAEAVDITPTHLKHIESGHRRPSVEVLFDIFNALNVSFDELSCGTEADIEKIQIISALDRLNNKEISFLCKMVRVIEESDADVFGGSAL